MDTLYSWTARRAGAAITVEHSCGKLVGVRNIAVSPQGIVTADHDDYGPLVLDTSPHRDATTERVNTGVSDLFFNHEQACEAYRFDMASNATPYIMPKLSEAADGFKCALRQAGIAPPTTEALVRDFLGRL